MLETLFWILVGAFIGWHIPQPNWAVMLKEKVKNIFRGK